MSERISIKDLEKMTQTKYVCTQRINLSDKIFGDNEKHILDFDVFDGFAYCPNYKGKEYFMTFPKVSFIKLSPNMSKSVREFMELGDSDEITITDSLCSYNILKCNE